MKRFFLLFFLLFFSFFFSLFEIACPCRTKTDGNAIVELYLDLGHVYAGLSQKEQRPESYMSAVHETDYDIPGELVNS